MTTRAERKLRKSPPTPTGNWMWFALFFATGTLIGVPTALAYVDHNPLLAIAIGSVVGGYGAWAVFFVAIRLAAHLRPRRPALKSPGPVESRPAKTNRVSG